LSEIFKISRTGVVLQSVMLNYTKTNLVGRKIVLKSSSVPILAVIVLMVVYVFLIKMVRADAIVENSTK